MKYFVVSPDHGGTTRARKLAEVLDAFGCGIYNLKSDNVSLLFKEVLEEDEFKNIFKVVAFAIYEGKGSSRRIIGKDGKFKTFYDSLFRCGD